MLNRKEKEELIVRLLNQSKTYKEISKEAHASYSEISSIRKRLEGNISEPSIQNQAYVMYLEGKRPIDVAIALHLDNVDATRYWKEYLQLKNEYKLLGIRLGKDDFSLFIKFYKEMKKKHYRLNQVKKALEIVDKIESESIYFLGLVDSLYNASWSWSRQLLLKSLIT